MAVVVIVVVVVLAVVLDLCNKYSATKRLKAVAGLRTEFLAAMPNGHRDPYEVASGLSPSPEHTSDGEAVCRQKREYHARSMRALPRPLREGAIGKLIFQFLRYPGHGRWWDAMGGSSEASETDSFSS